MFSSDSLFIKFLRLEIVTEESGVLFFGLDYFTTVEGSCECGTEPLGSIKCWEILELSDSTPWSSVVSY
jgi:hypothetical protein